MRILILLLLISSSRGVFAQKNLLGGELSLSTVAVAASYERFITNHFSLGAKLGLITIGAKANYYFKSIGTDQWNGHVGLGYELTAAWPVFSGIYGPTLIIGGEHILSSGFLIGLEGGVMDVNFGDGVDNNGSSFYPMINFKLAKLF